MVQPAEILRRAFDELGVAFCRTPARCHPNHQGEIVQRVIEFVKHLGHWLSGAIVRFGAGLGVATPVNRAIYAALKPFAGGGGG